MLWRVLPFGLVVILVIGMLLAAGAWGNQVIHIAREKLLVEKNQVSCLTHCERFAIVDEHALLRFLTREEFELLKNLNPRLIEMRAGDIHYLTEPPIKS